MALNKKSLKELAGGLLFLAPNILGFLAFVLIPLVFSFYMAFTNWDLTLHNMFKDEAPRLVGFDNFIRLFEDDKFWYFLRNTLFLMLGVPFSIAGSLGIAILLSKDLKGGGGSTKRLLLFGSIFVTALLVLVPLGLGQTGMVLVVCGLLGLILIGGSLGGSTVYRTLFYTPHFTAGVATFILWKKLYAPHTGPINVSLQPVLDKVSAVFAKAPAGSDQIGLWLLLGAGILIALWQQKKLATAWADSELGTGGWWLATFVSIVPWAIAADAGVLPTTAARLAAALVIPVLVIWQIAVLFKGERLEKVSNGKGGGTYFMFSCVILVVVFTLIGLAMVLFSLPANAAAPGGLTPPQWLSDHRWAKPALMIMGLWAAIGSNNMILYLAGITGISPELYEAAELDGAGPWAKFWNITWPQLAPITFFIVVMSVIGGLQGGFEMARTMTQGGPAGSTTTLSYYVYMEGFETGRLGFASAVAWVLFLMVFVVTIFNTRFGSRYIND